MLGSTHTIPDIPALDLTQLEEDIERHVEGERIGFERWASLSLRMECHFVREIE